MVQVYAAIKKVQIDDEGESTLILTIPSSCLHSISSLMLMTQRELSVKIEVMEDNVVGAKDE